MRAKKELKSVAKGSGRKRRHSGFRKRAVFWTGRDTHPHRQSRALGFQEEELVTMPSTT